MRSVFVSNVERSIYLQKMIDNVLNTRFESIPGAAVDHAKDRIIDTVGCLICGANDSGNPELLKIARDWGGKREGRIFVHGDMVPVGTAAMVNSIICRSFDFEPVSPLVDGKTAPGHISGTTITTALTVGDVYNVSGKELIAALLAGDDMAARMLVAGEASGAGRGRDHVGQVNSFGATAIAGRLIGLDTTQLRNAFGLVVDHLGGVQRMISETATGFKLSQGTSARDALFCVQLAGEGWTGIEDALLSEGGYYALFTGGVRDPDILIRNLGKDYYSDGTFKPYPCCRMNHAGVDCALAIVNRHKIAAGDIEEVVLYAAPGALRDIIGQPFRIRNFAHASAGFSLQYCVANVLLRGNSRPEHYTDEAIGDPAIADLTKRMKMAELTEGNTESARVKVRMKDLREFDEYAEIAKGDPRKPMSREELRAKFWTNIDFARTVTRENAERFVKMVEDLENLDNVKELVDLLVVRVDERGGLPVRQ
jgi:2-methylcitrate dehydratase PrpD